MANWANPTLASSYTNFLNELKARDEDLARGLDPANTSFTSPPTNAIRWNSASKLWQKWSGTAWAALSSAYAINIEGTVSAPVGAAATPSINFQGAATTGFYLSGNIIAASVAGANVASISPTSAEFSGIQLNKESNPEINTTYGTFLIFKLNGATRLSIGSAGVFVTGTMQATSIAGALQSSDVGSALIGITTGAVGSFALLRHASAATVSPGSVVNGSLLRYGPDSGGGTPSGTWRALGYLSASTNSTLFLRVT